MAGTIPLSMTQQFDVYGKPLAAGQLYIIQAGTVSTPQDAFADINLTIKMPYPMSLDAAGRVPAFFLADGYVKIRLQDRSGVVQLSADQVLVIGPSAGGGSGAATVDPNSVMQTGNIILRYGVGAFAGYVRLNGLTIGNQGAIPSATERGNADCQALFLYLWGADTSLVIVGGRGASASADWTAGKTLTLPDWRGYTFGCLDDMGAAAALRMPVSFPGVLATTLGAVGGFDAKTIALANLPSYTPAGTVGYTSVSTTVTARQNTGMSNAAGTTLGLDILQLTGGGGTQSQAFPGSISGLAFSGTAQGGTSTPFSIVGPRKLCTGYMRL